MPRLCRKNPISKKAAVPSSDELAFHLSDIDPAEQVPVSEVPVTDLPHTTAVATETPAAEVPAESQPAQNLNRGYQNRFNKLSDRHFNKQKGHNGFMPLFYAVLLIPTGSEYPMSAANWLLFTLFLLPVLATLLPFVKHDHWGLSCF